MQPLPLNFPQDFLPERRLLSRLLPFAGAGGSGDKVQIGAQTGIPTGASTGKVEPMIQYARGMGLLQATRAAGRWQLALTELGKMVMANDPYLSQPVTLWLLHLMLCRRHGLSIPATGIADAWFALFAEGGLRLGNDFTRTAYLDCLLNGMVPRAICAVCLGWYRDAIWSRAALDPSVPWPWTKALPTLRPICAAPPPWSAPISRSLPPISTSFGTICSRMMRNWWSMTSLLSRVPLRC